MDTLEQSLGTTFEHGATVICDTNIWYKIAEGEIEAPADLIGKNLIGTFATIEELCMSPYILKDYERIQRAITAFGSHYNGIITLMPAEYLKAISGHPYNEYEDFWQDAQRILEFIAYHKTMPDSSMLAAFRKYLPLRTAEREANFQSMNHIVQAHRSTIHRGRMKRIFRERAVKETNQELARNFIRKALVGGLDLAWDKIELFMGVFEEWMNQLVIQDSLKLTPTDFTDLLNLVYVRPGFMYWTHDDKKTRQYAKDRKLDHYFISEK